MVDVCCIKRPVQLSSAGDKLTHGDNRSSSADSGVALDLEKSAKLSYSSNGSVQIDISQISLHSSSSKVSDESVASRKDCDEVVEADSLTTCTRDAAVKLRMADSGPLSIKPVCVMTALRTTADRYPSQPALGTKVNGKWQMMNYSSYYETVRLAAKGFIKLGLEMYHGVGILGFNSAEWFISDLAAVFAGGLATGIYATNMPDACQYIAENAKCNIIVVENDHQLQKILKVWDQLPDLKAVVHYNDVLTKHPNVYSWAELLEFGRQENDSELNDRICQQAPNKCCTLIYTSGTTGNPKGVMLSHDNLVWTARMAGRTAKLKNGVESVISYLPLSHVAAQVLDIYIPLMYAATVYFAQPDALKGSLGDTLKEVRPTAFLGVPRVWEKIQEKMVEVGRSQSTMKRRIAVWAKGIGLRGNERLMNRGSSMPWGWTVANALVFRKVRQALGLDRCRMCMTAAAPIMRETLEFFASLNIPILEIYGMSETSGPHTMSLPWNYQLGSVGVEIGGCSTKLVAVDDNENNTEVCMNGRNMFMGYLNAEDKTRETLDDEGWLHSGDIGRRDDRGFLYITGRIKELLITAGGENVAPVPIEDAVKEQLPCVSNCMLIGDCRKFLSILLTFKTDLDDTTSAPTTKLTRFARSYFSAAGIEVSDVTELTSEEHRSTVGQFIQSGIDAANKNAVSRAQLIQKWTILPRDFSIPGGELGPTLKLKRPVVADMYKETIASLYAE